MSHLTRLNDCALDGYLRGDYGELLRREAQQVLYNRGREAAQNEAEMSEEAMVAELKQRGYVVFKPRKVNK
jgi:hypothetical protein